MKTLLLQAMWPKAIDLLGDTRRPLLPTAERWSESKREITVRPDNAYAMMRGAITLAYLGDHERARGCCEESCEPVYWGSIESSLGMGGSLLCCRDRDA